MTKEQNKKAPNLRFKGFTNDWEQRKLGEVTLEMYNGQTPSRNNSKFWNDNIFWLTSGELNHGTIKNTIEKISKLGQKDKNLRLVKKGTFVIAITGLEAAGIRGNCAILGIDTTLNQSVMAIYPDPKKVTNEFLFNWYEKVGQHYGIIYTQGTKQQSYNSNILNILPISITPSLKEQRQINQILKKVNDFIDLQQRKLELLKEIKKGLLQKMFADKSNFPILRFEGFHAEWEQRKLGEVIELEDNKRKPVKASKRIPGNIPYYGANGIQDYVKGYTHTGEHVLVAEDGANSISNYPVYFICSPSWINNHSHVLTGKGSIISNKFLTYNLKTVPYANYLVGSGRYKLNAETLKIIPIKLPLLTEQNYIGSTLSKIDKLITLQHQRLSKLDEIKKSLLQQMFI